MAILDIIGSYQDPNRLAYMSSSLTNVRAVINDAPQQKKGKVRLLGAPGLTTLCKPLAAAVLAMGRALGTTWAVYNNGAVYYDVHTAAPQLSGYVLPAPTKVVRLCEDITGLCIATDSQQAAVATKIGVTNYTQIGFIAPTTGEGGSGVSAGNLAPMSVSELDNMTIWAGFQNTTQQLQLYRSLALAPGTVDADWFASKEARADPLVDVMAIDHVLWVIGVDSTEQWYDAGVTINPVTGNIQTAVPFTPFPNTMAEVGLLASARATLAHATSNGFFVGSNFRVWQLQGQTMQPISPQWVDTLLQQTNPATLRSFAYSIGGDIFYMLTSVGAWSIELSMSTGLWNFRSTFGRPDHAGSAAVSFGEQGLVLMGLDTGEICKIDISTASEPAGAIQYAIVSPPVGAQETKHAIDEVQMTSAMGSSAGVFSLDWSEDNQQTWRGLRSLNFPTPGTLRAVARSLGTSRMRNIRLRYSGSQAPFTMDALYAIYTPGV